MAIFLSTTQIEILVEGVLFDMDGVLISSIASVERSWRRWAEGRQLDPAKALQIVHGCRAADTLRRLNLPIDVDAEVKVIENYEIEDQEGVHALAGIPGLIAALPPDRWTVVTSATRLLARARLAAVGITPPERMVTGDDVALGKPNPAPYLAGAAKLGMAAADCVVFEDALSGVAAGRAAGATVVATTFTHRAEELVEADYVVSDLSQMEVEVNAAGIRLRIGNLVADYTERRR